MKHPLHVFRKQALFFILAAALCGCTVFSTQDLASTGVSGPALGKAINFLANGDSVELTMPFGQSTVNFTMEAWIKLTNMPAAVGMVLTQSHQIGFSVTQRSVWIDNSGFINVAWTSGACDGGGRIDNTTTSLAPALSPGQKYHIAVSQDGTDLRIFINGSLNRTVAIGSIDLCNILNPTVIGYDFGTATSFPGIIDEVRMSDSARYTAAFTVPTTPFSYDANTLILFHADDGTTTGSFQSNLGASTYTFTGAPIYVTTPFP